jgi:hypothetical protein
MTSEIEIDEQHLNLLSIFHYIVGGLLILFSFLPIFHLIMGIFMVVKSLNTSKEAPLLVMGMLFICFALLFMVAGIALAILIFVAGYKISQRRNRTFCLVIAGCECLFSPFGLALGIFTIVVLSRKSVMELFKRNLPA